MATKYCDIVRLRGGKPAYNIEEEKDLDWETFIPNEQFNGVLKTVLSAVRGTNIDMHKSFWVNGTYGTGKSHAASVISHLLALPIDEIRNWVETEYRENKYAELRQSIYKVRDKKRLLPVKLIGLSGMAALSELGLVFQTAVTAALKRAGIQVSVPTDFETLMDFIRKNEKQMQVFIDEHPAISSFAPTTAKLIKLLDGKDMSVYTAMRDELHKSGQHVMLENRNLGDWLEEVQQQLTEKSPYNGLLIIWDEFTDVMNQFGSGMLKEIQGVVEKFMNEESNSFLLLVSHPSAFDKISDEEGKQTDGRYHRMKYNMEPVSAFKIMSRKFEVVDEGQYENLRYLFYGRNPELIPYFTTAVATDQEATSKDLMNLYPLHPGTAILATHYATVIGSSSRSVFEFLGQNEAITDFLGSEDAYNQGLTITPDYLWDFVLKVFQDDIIHYGAVTERFNSYRERVDHQGEAYMAVFKGVLLLNAFNNMSGENNLGLIVPSEANIKKIFEGSQYAAEVDEVLAYFNEEGIIQRAPGEEGLYSVQYTALPLQEIQNKKNELRGSQFRYTWQVISYGDEAKMEVEKRFAARFIRPYKFDFYSDEGNDSSVAARIRAAKRNAKPWQIYMAMLVGKDQEEKARLHNFALKKSNDTTNDKELADVFFVVFDEVLTDKTYQRFIEYQANCSCANAHGYNDQMSTHSKHASMLIKDFMDVLRRGNATVYVNGAKFPISVNKFTTSFNDTISPQVFPLGPESLDLLRNRAAQTFWDVKNSKEIVRRMFMAQTKDEIWASMGQIRPMSYYLQDALDDAMQWKPTVPATHPLKAICDFVEKKIKNAKTEYEFDFIEKFEELTRPPYGLYSSFAAMASVAFALKPYANKIFDTLGKPRDANHLVEDVSALFKAWDTGTRNSKLTFKFQTPEERKLCNAFIRIFGLGKPKMGYVEISSLKDARYAITRQFLDRTGYPLWTVKYASQKCVAHACLKEMTDDLRRLIDNIVKILEDDKLRNPSLVSDTLDLIGRNKIEISNLLMNDEAFSSGFNWFTSKPENGEVKPEEIDEAMTYLKQHLESTIGYWTEEEVSQTLIRWRNEKQKQQLEELQRQAATPTEPAQDSQPQQTPVSRDELEEKRTRAKAKIENLATLGDAKRLLFELCKLTNNAWLLDQINK